MNLNEFLTVILLNEHTIQKVESLWVEDPTSLAYYRLKGYQLEYGILDTDRIEVDNDFLYCADTRIRLVYFRKQFPEVTKRELMDMLRKRVNG